MLSWPLFARRIEPILQATKKDCGVCCLAMILRYHRILATVTELRRNVQVGTGGTTALALVTVSRKYGLEAVGVDIRGCLWNDIPTPAIVHWRRSHFVVLECAAQSYATIVDPLSGRRNMGWEDFWARYSGVAIRFQSATVGAPLPRRSGWFGKMATPLAVQILIPIGLAAVFLASVAALGPASVENFSRYASRFPASPIFVAALRVLGGGLAVLLLFALASWCNVLFQRLAPRTRAEDIVRHLLRLPLTFFEHRNPGRLAEELRQATGWVAHGGMNRWQGEASFGVAVLLALAFHAPGLALWLAGFATVRVGIEVFHQRRGALTDQDSPTTRNAAEHFLAKHIKAIWTVKATGRAEWVFETWRRLFVEHLEVVARRRGAVLSWEAALRGVGIAEVVTIAMFLAELDRSVEWALLSIAPVAVLAAMHLASVRSTLELFRGMRVGPLPALIDDIMASAPEDRHAGGINVVLDGTIRCDHVSAEYDVGHLVLEAIDFEVGRGRTLAVVGPPGAGKSTLVEVLLGIRNPTAGCVCYSGVRIDELDRDALRRQIGVASHRTSVLVEGTVAENIRFGNATISDEDMRWACKLVGVADEIEALPRAYRTYIRPGVPTLDTPQRYRLILARAVAARPVLLLLDEPLGAAGWRSELALFRSLAAGRWTTIVTTRHLAAVQHADEILMLDRGRVADRGAFVELENRIRAKTSVGGAQA